jgi:hypothetical protein
MFIYKAVNKSTNESFIPCKIEWDNSGKMIYLSTWNEKGELVPIDSPLDNWEIQMLYQPTDEEIEREVKIKKIKDQTRIGR